MTNWKKKLLTGIVIGRTYNYYPFGHRNVLPEGRYTILEITGDYVTKMTSERSGQILQTSDGWRVIWFGD